MAVPDFGKLIEVYKISGDLDTILGPLYRRMEINTPKGKKILYHKTVYNFSFLKKLLEDNGFIDVKRYDWRKTIHKNYDDHSQTYYPHMDKEKWDFNKFKCGGS